VRRLLRKHSGSLFGHAALQLVAKLYTSAAQLAVFVLVALVGSDELVASYAVSMAAAGLVATLVDCGAALWVIRHVAVQRVMPRLLAPRAAAVFLGGLAVATAAAAGLFPWSVAPWVLVAGATWGASGLWRGVLWTHLRYGTETLVAVVQSTVLLSAVAVSALVEASSIQGPMIATSAACFLGYFMRRRLGVRLVELDSHYMGIGAYLRHVYSYAGLSLVVSAQMQADLLLLAALWPGQSAGVAAYGLAMRFYYSISMPFDSLAMAILPRIARRLTIDWRRVVVTTVPLGLFAVVLMLVLFAHGELFGLTSLASKYFLSVGVVLCVALPFRFAGTLLGAVVTGSGNQPARLKAALLGLGTMLTLDVLLIPTRGPWGAAVALAISDIVLMLSYAWSIRGLRRHLS